MKPFQKTRTDNPFSTEHFYNPSWLKQWFAKCQMLTDVFFLLANATFHDSAYFVNTSKIFSKFKSLNTRNEGELNFLVICEFF